jgi:multiple sugar transport system substrate-binding protein
MSLSHNQRRGERNDQLNSLSRRTFLERARIPAVCSLWASSTGALLTTLNACSAPREASTNTREPITLTVWDYFYAGSTNVLLQRYENFNKSHPGIKIQRTYIPYSDMNQKVLLAAAAGTLPDLLLVDSLSHPTYSANGVLLDLTDRIKAWGQIDHYFPDILQSSLWQGKNYGLPNSCGCLGLYYNADMLEQAGVQPPTTWSELRSAAKKLTRNGIYGFATAATKTFEGTFEFLPFLRQAGADWDTLDSPAATQALQFLVDLIKDGSLSPEVVNWAQPDSFQQFTSGSAAMVQNGSWQLATLQEQAKFKWGVTALPKGQTYATSLGGENWTISKTSKHVDAAWEFIKFTQDPQNYKQYITASVGQLPARKDTAQDAVWQKNPPTHVFVNELPFARTVGGGQNASQISDIFVPALQSALTGRMSASDALKQVSAHIKSLL